MKNIFIVSLLVSIISPIYAFNSVDNSLPARCHNASVKLEIERASIESDDCRMKLSGSPFNQAERNILSNNFFLAKIWLDRKIKDLQYAKALNCPKQDIIDWGLSEANQIKDALN